MDTNGTTLTERDTNTHIHSTHTQPYDNSVKSTYIDMREIGRIIFGQRERERENKTQCLLRPLARGLKIYSCILLLKIVG